MDKASEAIFRAGTGDLRYRPEIDPDGIPQFDLVAEQVEKVSPDLVARDDQGKSYPATAARYRMAFKTSRAKDDPSDAQVCLELMLHHREKLNPWLSNDAQTRELSCRLQHRRAAVDFAHASYQYAARCTQELLSPGPGIGRSAPKAFGVCPAGLPLPAQMAFAPGAAQSAQRKCAQILLCAQLPAHGCD